MGAYLGFSNIKDLKALMYHPSVLQVVGQMIRDDNDNTLALQSSLFELSRFKSMIVELDVTGPSAYENQFGTSVDLGREFRSPGKAVMGQEEKGVHNAAMAKRICCYMVHLQRVLMDEHLGKNKSTDAEWDAERDRIVTEFGGTLKDIGKESPNEDGPWKVPKVQRKVTIPTCLLIRTDNETFIETTRQMFSFGEDFKKVLDNIYSPGSTS